MYFFLSRMSALPNKQAFMPYEIQNLKTNFEHVKAPLEKDFDTFELEAISQLGVLKHHPHIYLGSSSFGYH